jgi:hypothetical protein
MFDSQADGEEELRSLPSDALPPVLDSPDLAILELEFDETIDMAAQEDTTEDFNPAGDDIDRTSLTELKHTHDDSDDEEWRQAPAVHYT